MRLDGRVAIVTGCASGIGLATARAFVDAGARVFGVDRAAAPASFAGAASFAFMQRDLTEPDSGEAVVAGCTAAFGAPRILVNNAGIGDARPILQTSDADLARYLAANVAAPFALCRAAIAAMLDLPDGTPGGTRGAIVNIASIYGIRGAASSAAYGPSKAAVIGMTQQLATEYGRDGIRVNAVAPGMIETPLTAARLARGGWYTSQMVDLCPMGRVGRPEEIALACVFLASDAASFVNGVVLPVDGGWSSAGYLPDPATTNRR